eukprot:s658_g29.t1
MEVDRLEKGKSKGKGKKGKGKPKDGKGKGKDWSPWQNQGTDKGKGKGKSKGKGKMDQDYRSKAKGKGKPTKDGCFYCGKAGHRQAECWKKRQDEAKGIRQVELPASSTASVAGTAITATTSETTAGPSASQVRRIDLVDPESCCVIYDLSAEETQETAFDDYIRMLKCEVHRMDKDDDLEDWTYRQCESHGVACTGNVQGDQIEAILDSGSDMTVLPMTFHTKGEVMGEAPNFRHAQGNQLKGTSQRRVELVFEATTGERLKVRQMPTVAESVRQLRGICLVPKSNKVLEDVWRYMNGVPTFRTETGRHVDGRKKFGVDEYPYRTTMVLLSEEEKAQYANPMWNPGDEVWKIVECAVLYAAEGSMVEPTAQIPELEAPTQTLTMLHLVPMTKQEVMALVGKPAQGEAAQEEGAGRERPQEAVLVPPAQPEEQLVKAPQEFTEITYGENVITAAASLRVMRRGCQFYGLPKSGSKSQCWERLTRFLANAEMDAALEVAQRYQEDLVRSGDPIPRPRNVDQKERELHELTRLPKADWSEARTATKSREDAHKSSALKGDDTRTVVHIDSGYITGEAKNNAERAPNTTFLCVVDSQTKWTVAIPVPSKDKAGLKYVVQQLVNATAGFGDVNLLI